MKARVLTIKEWLDVVGRSPDNVCCSHPHYVNCNECPFNTEGTSECYDIGRRLHANAKDVSNTLFKKYDWTSKIKELL